MKKTLLVLLIISWIAGCAAPAKKKAMEGPVFYPPLPDQPRLQFLTSITSESDIGKETNTFEEFLTGESASIKSLIRPYDIASSKGKIYVLDREYKEFIVIDLVNKSFDYIRSPFGNFPNPSGIWVSEDDFKFIADYSMKSVIAFDSNNRYFKSYGKDILSKPLDVSTYGNNVYVCDHNLHQIIVFERDTGEAIRRIGEVGTKEGQLFKPTHIFLDKEENLFVTDAFNFRIQKFDPFGDFVRLFGFHGDRPGGFARPKGLAVDREDHLYVVDTAFENVQIFDANTGDTLLFFGGFGPKPGDMYLPAGIHVDYENVDYFKKYADRNFRIKYVLYVTNQYGKHKINVYGFGDWLGETALPAQ